MRPGNRRGMRRLEDCEICMKEAQNCEHQIDELSESLSDGISEQRLSGEFRSRFTRKEDKITPVSQSNKALL